MRILIFLFLIGFFAACDKEDVKDCGVGNPLEDLPWLKAQIAQMNQGELSQYMYMVQAEYRHQRVYLPGNCCPFCMTVPLVYDCQGNVVGIVGGQGEEAESENIDPDEITNHSVLWKSDGNTCVL